MVADHREFPDSFPNPKLLSIVIPLYNEAEVVPLLAARLDSLCAALPCEIEIVLVDDGSRDRTAEALESLAAVDSRYRVVILARNFGHQIAATAGLESALGDAIVLMDADLQDPPELILQMLAEYRKGFDVVYAKRVKREGETAFKKLTAWAFYRLMRTLVYRDLPPDVGDFRLMSRRSLDALLAMPETHRFLRGMVAWIGFPQTEVPFVRASRVAGSTKYPLRKMLRFAWTAAVSFSTAPLKAALLLGFLMFGTGIAYAVYAAIQVWTGAPLVKGWASVILLQLLCSGATLIGIGVVGEYVGRIFDEVKRRPLYIVSRRLNDRPNTVGWRARSANASSRKAYAAEP